MNSAFRSLAAVLIVLIVASCALAGESAPDKWFGNDKLKHLGLSAFLSGGSYIVVKRHFDYGQDEAFAISIGITVSLGGVKEIVDSRIPDQTSSYKDLIWDIAGAVAGAFLASRII